MKQYKYHYFYKIENLIDGKFYYGIHSTDKLEDGYMGSGSRLKQAMKIFGEENFKKEIIKYFETREKASEYEALMVTENLVQNKECYNIKCGGDYGLTVGTILVKDKEGNFTRVTLDDERYRNGELVVFNAGLVTAFDKKEKKYKLVESKEYHSNKERYIACTTGRVTVKDKNNKILQVSVDDERYRNGELVPVWTGRKHTKETKIKMSETYKKIHHQQGEKNSSYGTCWITKDEINKKIKKEDLSSYITNGWKMGRYIESEKIKYKTDEFDKDVVVLLYDKYKNWTKVASVLGVNRSTMLRYRKRMHINF